ncbi:cAMP-binding protein [Clostridium thermosuccinogenes]|jgi:CRP/FNR family transcriptional regulator|uniref:cAMP-binding protein n=1 Tax=Clostridium thermosuccinogenes TaxID=84032 RepID=A0A2K2FI18_9CLOT|nr:Crp/Fnr family transcriptional regulator [Pseudoclostridium thermosuccinogenes]AUS95593.1 cAMP-binding protein [Pseudoclostridium thermosuccinogenes]PNT90453.1 cAMP-binding protein [Pseudoclostridium thermosuccinogenes]PNT98410.1 cAMP-binding protein [Pseudoclostridium thermosuccinogenes]PNU00478.1 cAMP-binding protein [Pseudoclostridium thermosuccinogenes]
MKNTDYIKKFTFFSDLQEDDLAKIAAIAIERNYKKNMVVFMEGEPGEAFYYIKSGKVKVFTTYEDGHEHILYIFGEGDVFGEATLFNNIPYPASAVVYEDAVIGIIKNRDLERLVKENSELSLKIIKILVSKLVFAQQKIRELTFNDVFSRTASQLIKLSKDYGNKKDIGLEIGIQLSRQELADMIGSTRETVSRVISRFKKEKAITEKNDRIVIINEEKLRSWI